MATKGPKCHENKSKMNAEKRIIITHCVDPNRFYYKYVNDCVNCDYSKFDYEIQSYGNTLHAQKIEKSEQSAGYIPKKNEIIIFFDLMFNKWLRGRVINSDGDEINLWCIDNGIFRRANVQFIQPLTESFKRNFDLVHVGGLNVLPAENNLDFATLDVTMKVTNSWDSETKSNFKALVVSSKRISFVELMDWEAYKFGLLLTESNDGKVVSINEILLEMNKAIVCGRSAQDMWLYVSKERLGKTIYETTTSSSKYSDSKRTANASGSSEIEEQSNSSSSDGSNDSKLSLHSKNDNEDNSIRNHDEIDANFDNLSIKSDSYASSLDEYIDTFDNSVSMVLSTIHSLENESIVPDDYRNEEKTNSFGYECYLSTFGAIEKGTLRQPLQSSIDWINQMSISVAEADDNNSCISSIINLSDSDEGSTSSTA